MPAALDKSGEIIAENEATKITAIRGQKKLLFLKLFSQVNLYLNKKMTKAIIIIASKRVTGILKTVKRIR